MRQIVIWRRVAADNALRTAGIESTSFGPLDRNCVGYIEQTTTAKTNRACPKDGKIITRAKARIARGGIPTNDNLAVF